MSSCRLTARSAKSASLALVLLISGGCHHRKTQTLVLPPPAPVPLDTGGTPTAVLPPPPNPKLPDVPVAEAATQPKKVKKHAAKTTAAAPAPVAAPAAQGPAAATPPGGAPAGPASEAAAAGSATATSAGSGSAIGALTAGSEQSPKTMQEAAELISSNERRLSALTSQLAQAQAALVSKVRTFQRAAQQALSTGDAEGARTLAIKGKLLLDDLLGSGS